MGYIENPPKTFTNEYGQADGIFIDILKAIAGNEGWEPVFVADSFNGCLQKLHSGDLDLMTDVAFSYERAMLYSFHQEPVLHAWSQIYARKGLGIKSFLDLDGKRIAILDASIQHGIVQSMAEGFGISIEKVLTGSFDESFNALLENRADVAVTNSFFGRMKADALGLEDTHIMFNPVSLYYVTLLGGNLDLLEAIDRNLTLMKEDKDSAYYKALLSLDAKQHRFALPRWIRWLLLFLSLGFAFGFVSFWVMKRQVRLRTLELSEANREMESRIILRTAQLERAMQKAQEADTLKSAFLATMSHELRTPLNSIIGFTGVLLQELPGKLNEEQKKQLSMVQKSSRHLLSLINDVLDISKIEAGQLNLQKESFALCEAVTKVIDMLRPQAELKGLSLILNCSNPQGIVYTDKRRLEQILVNLISNAVKFTDSGSVSLDCLLEKDMLTLTVSDTGIGIEPDRQAEVFEPFRQIDSGLTRKYQGTGLGLSICKKLALIMGGSISLASQPGSGSAFTVILPVKSPETL